MKHFAAYLERGGPIVGLRTVTHAFRIPAAGKLKKYSWDYKGDDYIGGFGPASMSRKSWRLAYSEINHECLPRKRITFPLACFLVAAQPGSHFC